MQTASVSQTDLANSTGKNKSEISRLLSLLELAPDVQKIARDDDLGRITKRHLFTVAKLDVERQQKPIHRIQKEDFTVVDLERYVKRLERPKDRGNASGAPVTRRKYLTKHASILLTFRIKEVTDGDVLFTLDELRRQIKEAN